MLVGLTVKADYGEMTLLQAMKRSITYIVCAMSGSILFAIPFLRKDRKSLADIISKTNVFLDEEKSALPIELTVKPEEIPAVAEEKKAA